MVRCVFCFCFYIEKVVLKKSLEHLKNNVQNYFMLVDESPIDSIPKSSL